MRTNGTIQYKVKTGGGLDGAGDPIPVAESWSDPIRCLIIPGQGQIRKYEDGQMTAASYEIHIELQPFNHTGIRLTQNGNDLGEFQVIPQNIQRMEVSGRVKIKV